MLEDKRTAAELDEANLKKLFEEMGFEVTTRTDLTGAVIIKKIYNISPNIEFFKTTFTFVFPLIFFLHQSVVEIL